MDLNKHREAGICASMKESKSMVSREVQMSPVYMSKLVGASVVVFPVLYVDDILLI